MKNKILFVGTLLVSCFFSMNLYAQLEVQTSGDVTISKKLAINGASISADAAVKIYKSGLTGGRSQYGLYSYFRQISPVYASTGCGIGIYGCTSPASLSSPILDAPESETPRYNTFPFYAGVAGVASHGIGIYGSNSSSFPTTWSEGNYAGYFNGDVKVTGLLNGTNITLNADQRVQENITQLGNRSTADLLLQLNPISYTFSTDSIPDGSKETKRIHYGFDVQELQTIAPELVYTDGAGNLSIDYIALIPLLVQKVQILTYEVEELKKQSK